MLPKTTGPDRVSTHSCQAAARRRPQPHRRRSGQSQSQSSIQSCCSQLGRGRSSAVVNSSSGHMYVSQALSTVSLQLKTVPTGAQYPCSCRHFTLQGATQTTLRGTAMRCMSLSEDTQCRQCGGCAVCMTHVRCLPRTSVLTSLWMYPLLCTSATACSSRQQHSHNRIMPGQPGIRAICGAAVSCLRMRPSALLRQHSQASDYTKAHLEHALASLHHPVH